MKREKIKVVLNGEEHQLNRDCSIAELLAQLNLNRAHVAVELNGEILSRSRWEQQLIEENDTLEVVHFVGGGENVND